MHLRLSSTAVYATQDESHSSIHIRRKMAPSTIPGHRTTLNESDRHLTLSDASTVHNHCQISPLRPSHGLNAAAASCKDPRRHEETACAPRERRCGPRRMSAAPSMSSSSNCHTRLASMPSSTVRSHSETCSTARVDGILVSVLATACAKAPVTVQPAQGIQAAGLGRLLKDAQGPSPLHHRQSSKSRG